MILWFLKHRMLGKNIDPLRFQSFHSLICKGCTAPVDDEGLFSCLCLYPEVERKRSPVCSPGQHYWQKWRSSHLLCCTFEPGRCSDLRGWRGWSAKILVADFIFEWFWLQCIAMGWTGIVWKDDVFMLYLIFMFCFGLIRMLDVKIL